MPNQFVTVTDSVVLLKTKTDTSCCQFMWKITFTTWGKENWGGCINTCITVALVDFKAKGVKKKERKTTLQTLSGNNREHTGKISEKKFDLQPLLKTNYLNKEKSWRDVV